MVRSASSFGFNVFTTKASGRRCDDVFVAGQERLRGALQLGNFGRRQVPPPFVWNVAHVRPDPGRGNVQPFRQAGEVYSLVNSGMGVQASSSARFRSAARSGRWATMSR